jgi:hypothetical protein
MAATDPHPPNRSLAQPKTTRAGPSRLRAAAHIRHGSQVTTTVTPCKEERGGRPAASSASRRALKATSSAWRVAW